MRLVWSTINPGCGFQFQIRAGFVIPKKGKGQPHEEEEFLGRSSGKHKDGISPAPLRELFVDPRSALLGGISLESQNPSGTILEQLQPCGVGRWGKEKVST